MREIGAETHGEAVSLEGHPERGAAASPYAALRGLRVGCVQYLNARPLIYGYDGAVRFDHPSGLAHDLALGRLDAALVPVFEALGGKRYLICDGAAISSDGPVYSVFLAYRGPLEKIRSVALDPASLTSVHLLKVLLAEFHGLHPKLVAESAAEAEARLLIGNQAIEFRSAARAGFSFLDLGEEWKRRTGLPFVYAMWLLRPNLPRAEEVAAAFRELKRQGASHIPEIVQSNPEGTLEFRKRYLTQHIRFDFGPREKAGMEKFRELLAAHGLVPPGGKPLRYV